MLEPKSLVSFPSGIISDATEVKSPAPIKVRISDAVIPVARLGVLPSLSIAGPDPVPVFQALSVEL